MIRRIHKLVFAGTVMLFVCPNVLARDCVILLHGLARTENSMNVLAAALEHENYLVVNQGYKSRSEDVKTLAAGALPQAIKACGESENIDVVTHSLGGILLRTWLADNALENLHHVVMLGPPNQGSEVVDKLGAVPGFGLVNGPAGKELRTDVDALPQQLGPVDFKLGVIAGSDSFNPVLSTLIPGEDDGKVSIERTKVGGMADHIVLPVSHTFMMRNKVAVSQTLYFLKHGRFHREDENSKTE